jgi:peptide deformylase
VTVRYYDEKGNEQTQKLSGFNAAIVQHELDHLNGVLFVDKLAK